MTLSPAAAALSCPPGGERPSGLLLGSSQTRPARPRSPGIALVQDKTGPYLHRQHYDGPRLPKPPNPGHGDAPEPLHGPGAELPAAARLRRQPGVEVRPSRAPGGCPTSTMTSPFTAAFLLRAPLMLHGALGLPPVAESTASVSFPESHEPTGRRETSANRQA